MIVGNLLDDVWHVFEDHLPETGHELCTIAFPVASASSHLSPSQPTGKFISKQRLAIAKSN